MESTRVRAVAPGRVNLIGDHTDYTGGLVLPMAIDLATTVVGRRGGAGVFLDSEEEAEEAVVPLGVGEPARAEPAWARYVAGIVSVIGPPTGFAGRVSTTLPLGAGLSSSAALEVAVALALGFEGSALELALACQKAEQLASGVPSGIMDQLASAAGVEDHALLIDCEALTVGPVAVPEDVDVVVIHSGEPRRLADSAYGERRAQCEAAAGLIGPLRRAALDEVEAITDPLVRARARHVVTENRRVSEFATALEAHDLDACGALMVDSHRSLREDFEVSTPRLDSMVEELVATAGVYGARLSGAGFGGCVVALARQGALHQGWRVKASGGAFVEALAHED
ncbi:MAG TPA: galactokinase [Acidimicrobiales bacterium]|nr:galactokinase [Acidimicrobiales bacterium]